MASQPTGIKRLANSPRVLCVLLIVVHMPFPTAFAAVMRTSPSTHLAENAPSTSSAQLISYTFGAMFHSVSLKPSVVSLCLE